MPQYTRLLALGDSETYGARSTHGRTYPQLLEERLNEASPSVPTVVLNRGVNGERSWEIVNRGVDYLLGDDWIKVLTCMMGTNDTKPAARTPIDYYIAQWDRLARACRCTDTLLYALEIHAINPLGQPEYDSESVNHMRRLNAALQAWAVENYVPFVDGLFQPFLDNPGLLADGIHPTNEGNVIIANRVAEVVGGVTPVRVPVEARSSAPRAFSEPRPFDTVRSEPVNGNGKIRQGL